jgi:hypothetical protein
VLVDGGATMTSFAVYTLRRGRRITLQMPFRRLRQKLESCG